MTSNSCINKYSLVAIILQIICIAINFAFLMDKVGYKWLMWLIFGILIILTIFSINPLWIHAIIQLSQENYWKLAVKTKKFKCLSEHITNIRDLSEVMKKLSLNQITKGYICTILDKSTKKSQEMGQIINKSLALQIQKQMRPLIRIFKFYCNSSFDRCNDRITRFNEGLQLILNSDDPLQIKTEIQKLDRQTSPYEVKMGNRGLVNMGNTCYLNSPIQCFLSCSTFNSNLEKQYGSSKNVQNNNNKSFIHAYLEFVKQAYESKMPFQPRSMKRYLQNYDGQFKGYAQKDSAHCILSLINMFRNSEQDLVKSKSIKFYETDKKNKSRKSSSSDSNDAFNKDTIVTNEFFGQLISLFQCTECDSKKKFQFQSIQEFSVLHLPFLLKNHSIKDCFVQFSREEQLKGQNAWFCKVCNRNTTFKKWTKIRNASNTLIFCLSRYKGNEKLNHKIECLTQITLQKIAIGGEKKKKYELCGVINHKGSTIESGHYNAYCKDSKNQWREFNDQFVKEINIKNKLNSQTAYVLFYRLIK